MKNIHTLQAMTDKKSTGMTIVLYLLFFYIGAHRFYTQGATAFNIIYVLSFGFLGVMWFIDFFLIWTMAEKANKKNLLEGQMMDEAFKK